MEEKDVSEYEDNLDMMKVNLKMAFTGNMHHKEHHRRPLEQPKSQSLEEPHRQICLRMDRLGH